VDNYIPVILALVTKTNDPDPPLALLRKTLKDGNLEDPATKHIVGHAMLCEVLKAAFADLLEAQ
jgi:hypothetical protein